MSKRKSPIYPMNNRIKSKYFRIVFFTKKKQIINIIKIISIIRSKKIILGVGKC